MSSQYQFGYVGVGTCLDCYNPKHLWAYSGYEVRALSGVPRTACENCWHRIIAWCIQDCADGELRSQWLVYDRANLPSQRDGIVFDEPVCEVCYNPEDREHSSHTLVEAHLMTSDVLLVHRACSLQHTCCNVRYATYYSRAERDSRDFTYFSEVQTEGTMCSQCFATHANNWSRNFEAFHECPNCNEHCLRGSMVQWDGERYCENCYSDNVYNCEECDYLIWSGDSHDCPNDEHEDDSVIHSFSYKPTPYFFGKAKYHLGFELEVETRSQSPSRYSGAETAQDELGAHAYIKEDGSLNDGFEIVTHPHTLNEYQSNFGWHTLDKLRRQGYRSWNTETCGLHVHISRTAFGITNEDGVHYTRVILARQAHELRFMKLIYDNQRQVERIAGRNSTHYASFQDKGNLVRKVKYGSQNNGRYSAVNTDNNDTLEVRVFRGSLRKERVLSALEFVHACAEYTRDLPVNGKNRALTWLHFTAYVSNNAETYPNLSTIMSESFAGDTSPDEN